LGAIKKRLGGGISNEIQRALSHTALGGEILSAARTWPRILRFSVVEVFI
jgi:hypothetical protein